MAQPRVNLASTATAAQALSFAALQTKMPSTGGGDANAMVKRIKRDLSITPPREERPLAWEMSPIFCDPEADFEIISGDQVCFKIQSYYVLANSPFFRQLKSEGRMNSPYPMPHESAETIENFLSLMVQRPIPLSPHSTYIARISRLSAICYRAQCSFLLDSVITSLRESLGKPDCEPVLVFMTAAVALKDPETCRRALPSAARMKWSSELDNPSSLAHGKNGCSMLDITAMPLHMLERLSPRYVAALGRWFRLLETPTSKRGVVTANWHVVAKEFYDLLTEKEP